MINIPTNFDDLIIMVTELQRENEELKSRYAKEISLYDHDNEILSISESRYRRLFESAKDGILILDAENGKIVDVNQFLIDLLGYAKEIFIGKEIWQISLFKDIVANQKKFLELQEREYVRYENLPLETFDGRKINVEFVSNVYIENKHKVIQCNIRDITERKHHEEELHKLSQAVQQSPASVVITDIHGNIEFANAKTTSITGYTFEELVGKNPRIFASGELAAEEYKTLWDTIIAGNEWRGEFHNKKKNGELFWERATISPIMNDQGAITNYIAIKEDITDNKKMLDELILAKEKAEEMNRVKSSFFSNMSHELRTPLIGVLGFAEILEEQLSTTHELSEMARTIRLSGQRLMRTLNFILDIAKLESTKTQLLLQEINIVSALKETSALFASIATQKNLDYTFHSSESEICCLIDRGLFSNLFDNLLNNAVKFTQHGSVKINICTRNENAIIKIADTGLGISVSQQNIIWDEFRQASEGLSRQYEGTGLGLTIAKKYTEIMGGQITVQSAPGVGTTFTIVFPVVKCNSTASIQPQTVKKQFITNKIPSAKLQSVLYVEDDAVSIIFVRILLKDLYRLDIVQSGKEAIMKAREYQYDAILMDINLRQGMNGLDATKVIRTISGYGNTPIFACTAYAMEDEVKDFLNNGMSHHLAKPFTKQTLISALENVLI